MRSCSPAGMPGPWSTTRTRARRPHDARAHGDRLPCRVRARVLEQVGERPLELRRVGAHERQVGVDATARRARRRGRADRPPLRAGPPRASTTAGAARRAPACSRERSSRFVDQRGQPRRLLDDAAAELAALLAGRARPRRARSPAATIAVSGVRRSCETERSSAVLTTSQRRSARVSTTSAAAGRARAPPRAARRARGTTRCSEHAARIGGADAGARRRGRPRARSTGAGLDASRACAEAAPRRRWSAGVARLGPLSRIRARSAARSASRRRCSASTARAAPARPRGWPRRRRRRRSPAPRSSGRRRW